MMRRANLGVFISLALFLIFAAGCATLADVRKEEGGGTSRVYEASFDTVWNAVPDAINQLGPKVVATDKQEGYILAERQVTAFSWGEKIAVFVKKVDESHTEVEVVSKRAMATNITAPNWENRILNKLEEQLRTH